MAESPSLSRAFPLRGFQLISESTTWRGQLLFLMRKVVADGYATLFSTWDPCWSNLIFWWWASWGIPNVLHFLSNRVSKGITQNCKQPSCKVQQQNVTRLSSKSILVSVRPTKDTDLYQKTGNENVLLPASFCLRSFPRKPANQSWCGDNYNLNRLLCPFSCPLNWMCVCKAEIWLNNVLLGAQKKRKVKRNNSLTQPPDCEKQIIPPPGQSSGTALGRPARRRLGETRVRTTSTDVKRDSCGEPASTSAATSWNAQIDKQHQIRTWKSPQPQHIKTERINDGCGEKRDDHKTSWSGPDCTLQMSGVTLGIHPEWKIHLHS